MAVDDTRRLAGVPSMSGRLLVVGAHAGDFVWRAAGAIAVTTAAGGAARVIALSYGERGESGELWHEAGQTMENVKEIRHAEAERAAAALGGGLSLSRSRRLPAGARRRRSRPLADEIREFAPDVLVTHTDRDPFNPDHAAAFAAVERARALAERRRRAERLRDDRAAGPAALRAPPAGALQLHPDDLRRHHARDGSEARRDGRDRPQTYLQTYYAQRAEQRGNHARRVSGDSSIQYAEAFQRVLPQVVSGAVTDACAQSSPRLGVATVYEAAGRAAGVTSR